MRRLASGLAWLLLALALGSGLSCEKETHRASRQAFQQILAQNLPPDRQAVELERFVGSFPEPKTNPNLMRALSMLAEYHARASRPDIAASWFERAVRIAPDDPDLLNALGYHYASHGMDLDRAVIVLESAVRFAQEAGYAPRRQGFIKDSLGWAYRMRGDLPLAVAILEEANRLAPGVTVIQDHLADAYHAIGERDKAVSITLDLYLKGWGTNAALRERLRVLGREGGRTYAREVERRVQEGLNGLVEVDRRETVAAGASQVRFTSPDGQRLFGSLYRPREAPPGAKGASPQVAGGVLLLHPLGSNRGSCAQAAAALAARGFVALAVDLRGHGASVSDELPDAHAFSARLADNLRMAEQDVGTSLGALARQPGVDPLRLGIIGAGMGAYLAARAMLFDRPAPRPAALVLLSPWGRAEAYRGPLSRLPPEDILLIAGSEEGATRDLVQSLAAPSGSGSPRMQIVDRPGAHFELVGSGNNLIDEIAQFLKARLAPRGVRPERAG